MSTFNGTYGSQALFASVSAMVDDDPATDGVDIHTITLVLNGQHGEFDLRVEGTDADMEDVVYTGIARRYGGVQGFKRVTE